MIDKIKELLFAPRANCMGCKSPMGADEGWLCNECNARLMPLYTQGRAQAFICKNCGEEYVGGVCEGCHRHNVGVYITSAAYEYDFPASELVKAFKFHGAWKISAWMAEEMKKSLDEAGISDFDIIVPVPLHFARQFERGYNQAEKLALELGKLCGKPIVNALKRIKHTRQQAKLSSNERRLNLKGAFKCTQNVTGKRVLLIDDVRTTGTTCIRSARELEASGAKEILVSTFACAVRNKPATKKFETDKGKHLLKMESDIF